MLSRKLLAVILLCGASLQAGAFPFEVNEDVREVQVAVDTSDLGDNTGAVFLENYGKLDARCKVRFRSGPSIPVVRSSRVLAGQKVQLTAGFNHEVIRMRVDVLCQPLKGKK